MKKFLLISTGNKKAEGIKNPDCSNQHFRMRDVLNESNYAFLGVIQAKKRPEETLLDRVRLA